MIQRWDLSLEESGHPDVYHATAHKPCVALRDHWLEHGVDIGAYAIEESADDIEFLRRALGAKRLRLIGASYGSHLGLSVIRRHEAIVERAVLALVEGPDHTHKLPSRVRAALALYAEMAREDPGPLRRGTRSARSDR
jgi:pimeloyl-ACP methyl ester carboxylesterase